MKEIDTVKGENSIPKTEISGMEEETTPIIMKESVLETTLVHIIGQEQM